MLWLRAVIEICAYYAHKNDHGFYGPFLILTTFREFLSGSREAAQAALGHKRIDTTSIYTGRNIALQVKIAQQIG